MFNPWSRIAMRRKRLAVGLLGTLSVLQCVTCSARDDLSNYVGASDSLIPASAPLNRSTPAVQSSEFHDVEKSGKWDAKISQCYSPLGWQPGWAFYGEFLYWRARDVEVAWGVEINSIAQTPPIQVSPVAAADMDFQPGWRVGFSKIVNECTRINAEYTMWESGTADAIQRQDITNVISSLVDHPSVLTAAGDHINGNAQYDMSIDMVDLALQRAYYYDCGVQLSWLMGVRSVTHESQFSATYFGQIQRTIDTDIDFNGAGPDLAWTQNSRWGVNG